MTIRDMTEEDLKNINEYFYHKGGKLYAKFSYHHHVKKDQEVGYLKDGYKVVCCKSKVYYAHRIVYYLHTGKWPSKQIDHINGDKADNRPENLREVTHRENQRSFNKTNSKFSSKYRGVCWAKSKGKWITHIHDGDSQIYLGYFTCEKESALAYNYKAMEMGFNPEAFNRVFEDIA